MDYPYTETGHNMFDMISMMQKAIRRGDYEHAGFAAAQLTGRYRTVMWNRIYVISAEDCYGVLTKEIVALRHQDENGANDSTIANALALMCRAKKSRDACYFSCNFILDNRCPRTIEASDEEIQVLMNRTEKIKPESAKKPSEKQYDQFGFEQVSFFGQQPSAGSTQLNTRDLKFDFGYFLQVAIMHRDMDLIGTWMDDLRKRDREYLWRVIEDYAVTYSPIPLIDEIKALHEADKVVNQRKKDGAKDEIFISKAVMLLCYAEDGRFETVLSNDIIEFERGIDWSKYKIKAIKDCGLRDGEIPEWVYDCHTLKGKQMGKTDWDMTVSEQAALHPLQLAYFDEASWIYTYEQDFRNGSISEKGIAPIREFAKTHPANPVAFIPY